MTRKVFTVSQVNRYVKSALHADALLAGIFIEGELSNFSAHSSGHMYFTLKDAGAAISGVMFKTQASTLNFNPQNGMKIIAFGHISLYEKTGQYQFYAEVFEPAGVGGLQLAFRQLCEKLQAEGMFDEDRKRSIPKFAGTIAVITSPTGAAVQDIIRTIRQRNHTVRVVVVPVKVQGDGAATDIAQAIKLVNSWKQADVIIVGRGGGSIEDLWAFNEEILARAIVSSNTPIISAVGHETDFTVADFCADARAATPTAAAVLATYSQSAVLDFINQNQARMQKGVIDILRNAIQQVHKAKDNLGHAAKHKAAQHWQHLQHYSKMLEKASPYAAFRRGYALVRDTEGIAITDANNLEKGQVLTLAWANGTAEAKVDKIRINTNA